MAEMVEFSERTRRDLFSAVRADLRNHSKDSFDVALVSGDHQRLRANGRLLATWSPLVRALLVSNCLANDLSVFLPDFDLSTISRVVELLEMGWEKEEEMTITQEMNCLLKCFGTDLGKMEPVRSKRCEEVCLICDLCDERISNVMKHMEVEHGDLVLTPTEMENFCRPLVKEEDVKESEADGDDRQSMWANLRWENVKIEVEDVAIEDLEVGDVEKEEHLNVAQKQKKAKVFTKRKPIKCPKCGLSFKNTVTLKRHVGVVHFDAELMAKAEGMFEGAKCSQCGKTCSNKFSKKMHMLHHHTEVGPDISHEIEKIMKLNSSKGLIRKLQKGKTSKSSEVKEDIEKAISEIGDILEDLEDVAEAEMIQEQLLKMQEISDEEDKMSEEEAEPKSDGKTTTDPYVRRSLRVYSIFNPSVGDIVAQELY